MSNPYSPPKAPVDDPQHKSIYSDEYKQNKSAVRPIGVVLIVVFYFVFSGASAALLMIEGESWWIAHVVISALLAYWFRKLWWGDDRERKIAVFLGFFVGSLNWFGSPEGPVQSWSASEFTSLAEGCYFFLAACYLIYARKSSFFEAPPAR